MLAADGVTVRSGSLYGNQVGFTGRYQDKETGLWYYRSRFYSPGLGVFISRQPWSEMMLDTGASYSRHAVDRQLWRIGEAAIRAGHSNYIQNRFSLYSYAFGDPANHVEPYSWPLVLLLLIPPFIDDLEAPETADDYPGNPVSVVEAGVAVVGGSAIQWAWKAVCCAKAAGAASSTAAECCVTELRLTATVAGHAAKRTYVNSPLLVREITAARPGVPDPGGLAGALRWDVPGAMNGSCGVWELVIDSSGRVVHFLFKSN